MTQRPRRVTEPPSRTRLTTAASHVYASPLTPASLDPEVAAAFGISASSDHVTRREAMRVPAVRRARAIIAGVIGAMDWRVTRDGQPVTEGASATLVGQPDPNTTPQYVWTWTVDDLIFNGLAWLRVTERDPATQYPRHLERIARERVGLVIEDNGYRVYVDGRRAADRDLIRIDGPDEGMLEYGATVLRTAIMLEAAARKFARLDVPLGYLTPESDAAQELSTKPGTFNPDDPEDVRSEVEALLDEWETARETRTTAWLNRAVKYVTVMFDAQRVQLAESRKFQSAEIANLANLPPRYVNAPQASGMTYSTTESDRRDLLDTCLGQYITAVSQRLSMPDVTPRGYRVGPDVRSFLAGDLTIMLGAGETAIRIGVADAAEVRSDWLRLPGPPPPAPPAPTSSPNP